MHSPIGTLRAPDSHGLILVEPSASDFIFGGATGIYGDEAIDVAAWIPWYSPGEYQFGVYFDTWACTTFSAIKVYSAMRNYALAGGVLSNLFDPNAGHLPGLPGILKKSSIPWLIQKGYVKWSGTQWYFDASERFTAKRSGTVVGQGNSAQNVWNSIRNHGLVPQEAWPYPREQRTPPFTAQDFYADTTTEADALGLEYAAKFPCQYEQAMVWDYEHGRINADAYTALLRRSPLQIFGHAWDQPVNDVYLRTTRGINHAFSGGNQTPRWPIFDSYPDNGVLGDFTKQLAEDYIVWPWAFKPHITDANSPNQETQMSNVKVLKDASSPKCFVALPIADEASFVSYCENFGIPIIRHPDGSANIEAMLQGSVTLNP
jgi:hypothetical protein